MEDVKIIQARLRIDAARKHLTEALEAISGPVPDAVKCEAFLDMANDVLPTIINSEFR